MYNAGTVKRGRSTTIYFPLIVAGANDFATGADYTYAAGDVKISIDGGSNADPTNAPVYSANARMWALTLTDAELRGEKIKITLIDSATKAVEDQAILVLTENAVGVFSTSIATLASQIEFTLVEGFPDNDVANGWALLVTDAGNPQQRTLAAVEDYVGATRTVTLDRTPGFAIAVGDYVELVPSFLADQVVAAGVSTIEAKVDDIQGAGFDTATDSLEAIRDRGDSAWVTGGGGAAPTVEDIRTEMDSNSTQLAAIVQDTGTTLPAAISALATSAALTAVANSLADVLVDTSTTLDDKLDAVKAITDQISFTAGNVNANAEALNGVLLTGDGQSGTEFSV